MEPWILAYGLRDSYDKTHFGSPEVSIIGVEPQTIDFSMELSQPLRHALPNLVDLVARMAASL